jgi:hypothetical protein
MPVIGGAFVKVAFAAAKQHPKECKMTRVDIDRRVRAAIEAWRRP